MISERSGRAALFMMAGWSACLLSAALSGTASAVEKHEFLTPGGSLEEDIAKARATAAAEGKLVFLKFTTAGCGQCGQMEKETFSDAEVKTFLARHAVPVPIEIRVVDPRPAWEQTWGERRLLSISFDKPHAYFSPRRALYEEYDVRILPTLAFTDGNGVLLDRHEGYLSKEGFLWRARLVVSGTSALDHARAESREAGDSSPALRQALAGAFAQRMRHEEALAEYEWCLEEGVARDPSFVIQRPSVFPRLIDLAKRHPPAKRAVQARLAEAKAYLLQGREGFTATLQMASDVSEIHHLLDQPKRSKQLYKYLRQDPALKLQSSALLAAGIWKAYSKSALMKKKIRRKEWLAERFAADELAAAAEFLLNERKLRRDRLLNEPETGEGSGTLAIDLYLIELALPMYRELLELEGFDQAERVADALLALVEGRLVFGALAKAGVETGNMNASHAQWAWDSVEAHPDSWENLVTLARILAAQGQKELGLKMIQERLQNAGPDLEEEERRALKRALRKQRGRGQIRVPLKN